MPENNMDNSIANLMERMIRQSEEAPMGIVKPSDDEKPKSEEEGVTD